MQSTAAQGEERGMFEVEDFAEELRGRYEPGDRDSLWFENDHVRVFEVRLDPGERGPFHVHDRTYFWTVVEPAEARSGSSTGPMWSATR